MKFSQNQMYLLYCYNVFIYLKTKYDDIIPIDIQNDVINKIYSNFNKEELKTVNVLTKYIEYLCGKCECDITFINNANDLNYDNVYSKYLKDIRKLKYNKIL